jgi:two-component system NtrC family sensor kinase
MRSGPFRVLVVDDNQEIHVAFGRLLGPRALESTRRAFGGAVDVLDDEFELDYAFDGAEGIARVVSAIGEDRPYALVFMDIRMPGMTGIEALAHIWRIDPAVQCVVCTGTQENGWRDSLDLLGEKRDRLLVLRKPFDPIEAQQVAHMLARKWLFDMRRKRIAV